MLDSRIHYVHLRHFAKAAERLVKKFMDCASDTTIFDFLALPKAGLALALQNRTSDSRSIGFLLQNYPDLHTHAQ